MKPSIHPQYFASATVTCACGNKFTTGSTVESLHTEICSNCHPFYTGKQNLIDALGRVDRFKKAATAASQLKATIKPKKERKARVKK